MSSQPCLGAFPPKFEPFHTQVGSTLCSWTTFDKCFKIQSCRHRCPPFTIVPQQLLSRSRWAQGAGTLIWNQLNLVNLSVDHMRRNLSKFTPMNINIFTQMSYIYMDQKWTPILRNMTHLGYSVFIILQNIACRMKKSLSLDWEIPNEFLIRFASFCPELKLYPDVKTVRLTLFGQVVAGI